MSRLSVIVPTYNERENLEVVTEKIMEALRGLDFEMIVVDDNSPDGTGELAEELSSKYGNFRVVHRSGKLGLGTAVLDGVKVAQGDFVSVIDADLQHPPELLKKMFEKAEDGADIVIASRYIEGGSIEGWSLVRRIISKGALWLSHLLLKGTRNVKDPMSGYFVFRKDVIEDVHFGAKGFKLLVEILVKGDYDTVVEVPYMFKPRTAGESKMGLNEILNYLGQLIRLSDYRTFKFLAVGISGVFVNLGLLFLLVTYAHVSEFLAAIFSIEASIVSNFLLNDFWTFRDRRSGRFVIRLVKCHGSALGPIVNYIAYVILLAAGVNYIIADGVGILLGFIANYLFSEMVVWS
ncbi:MAG: glycosyltransferase [Nitrososphaeria archaeon]